MDTLICSACGCSLVRLGISREHAVPHGPDVQQPQFCCQGCLDLFVAEPKKYLRLTDGVTVCPACLGEKPPDRVATFTHAGQDVPYCGCPYCVEMFRQDPDFYLQRLDGTPPVDANIGIPDGVTAILDPARAEIAAAIVAAGLDDPALRYRGLDAVIVRVN